VILKVFSIVVILNRNLDLASSFLITGPPLTRIPRLFLSTTLPKTGVEAGASSSSDGPNGLQIIAATSAGETDLSFPKSPKPYKNKKRRRKPNVEKMRKKTDLLLKYGTYETNETNEESTEESLSTSNAKVTRRTFNNLMEQWAHSGHPESVVRVESLLSHMEQMLEQQEGSSEHDAPPITPDTRIYNSVIFTYAKSKTRDAGQQAEFLLNKMTDLYSSDKNPLAKPNVNSYNGVMEAYANSGIQRAASDAQRLLDTMMESFASNPQENLNLKPNVRSFNAVINAWAKSAPITESGELAAEKAEQCLDIMEELYETDPEKYADIKPHVVNYNAVIHAWANSKEGDGAERSEEVLARLEKAYQKSGGEANLKPNVKSYNAVIDAWAKSGHDQAPEKALSILNQMQTLYEAGNPDVKPNVRSFNSVMNAWAKSGDKEAPAQAEELLRNMERLYKEEGNTDVQPDVHSFSTVINAWARSHTLHKAEKAREIFKYMECLYEEDLKQEHNSHNRRKTSVYKPNVIIFNSVMNACAFTIGDEMEQKRSMEIAHEMFKELENGPFGNPDQVTYGTFLKVCANQMPEGDARMSVIELVFKKCCRDGQVGDLVLRQIQSMAGKEMFNDMMGKEGVESVRDLPYKWWCNVRERRRHLQFSD